MFRWEHSRHERGQRSPEQGESRKALLGKTERALLSFFYSSSVVFLHWTDLLLISRLDFRSGATFSGAKAQGWRSVNEQKCVRVFTNGTLSGKPQQRSCERPLPSRTAGTSAGEASFNTDKLKQHFRRLFRHLADLTHLTSERGGASETKIFKYPQAPAPDCVTAY